MATYAHYRDSAAAGAPRLNAHKKITLNYTYLYLRLITPNFFFEKTARCRWEPAAITITIKRKEMATHPFRVPGPVNPSDPRKYRGFCASDPSENRQEGVSNPSGKCQEEPVGGKYPLSARIVAAAVRDVPRSGAPDYW